MRKVCGICGKLSTSVESFVDFSGKCFDLRGRFGFKQKFVVDLSCIVDSELDELWTLTVPRCVMN